MTDSLMWQGMFGVLFWLVWIAVCIAALVAFFRGMRALTRIADALERLERRGGPFGGDYGAG